MSNFNLSNIQITSGRLLGSAAVLALVVAGATGKTVLSGPPPAQAAPVTTSNLPAQPAPSFAALIDHVRPAVVAIKVKMESLTLNWNGVPTPYENLPPRIQQFFKQFEEQNGLPQLKPQPMFGEGSGFFVSSDGYIVTNNHVVDHAKSVTVTTNDGRILDARVIGVDPKTDVALLKVVEKGDYPYVTFAKEAPKIGDWVVAIGNPYGLGGTATAGIVSAQGRDIGVDPYDSFLQIDAPINKGNSGGPTFNMKGEVVGVNTAIYSPSGGSVGIGFAIPAGTVEPVVNALEHGGVVARGFLGVRIQPVSQDMAESLGLKKAGGAMIDETTPGTPAAAAGLAPGDVITKVDGQQIADAAELTRRIGSLKPGDKVELSVLSGGAEKTVPVTLGSQERPAIASAAPASNSDHSAHEMLGVQLAPAEQIAGAGDQGVAVVDVDPDGPAASKGVTDGDVILKVSGHAVSRPEDVRQEIAAAKRDGRKAVLFQMKTAAGDRFVAFALPGA